MRIISALAFFQLLSCGYSGSLNDVEHIIIFMQENRAWDHYFGKLKGVRGFNDRITLPLPSGFNSFYQPTDEYDLEQYMLPFHAEMSSTSANCMDAPEMNYECDMRMWNEGHCDAWNTGRSPGTGMSYFTREDLPYYYTLYDNFVAGDQYFQSTFTQTNPNRLHLFSGSNGLSVGESAVLDNTEPRPGFNWTTMGEVLEAANVSWRVYQQLDNFDDNGFAWFYNYQKSRPGDALFDKGMMRQKNLIQAFEDDIANGNLPQVSWLVGPADLSEHATHHPSAGEAYTSRILDVLKKYPDVYAKSAFILNYDEGGQFFDHAWTPTPPLSSVDGISTASVEGEVNNDVKTSVPAPIGLGFRVPLLIVSPWTRGNIVVSQVFDHTSVLQLIEKRFNVYLPTISAWRRAVTGDMVSAFDFDHPDYTWPELPDTSNYTKESFDQCSLPYPTVPEEQSMPVQEEGTRISRALPYEFNTYDSVQKNEDLSYSMTMGLSNTGAAGAPFILYDTKHLSADTTVKKYAVESGKSIEDNLEITEKSGEYGFSLLGPNGYARQFKGFALDSACKNAASLLEYDTAGENVKVVLTNSGTSSVTFHVVDNAYGLFEETEHTVSAGTSETLTFNTKSTGNWYDISTSVYSQTTENICFVRRYAGRMETGEDTISDPAMGYGVPDVDLVHRTSHPPLPWKFRSFSTHLKTDLAKVEHKDELHFFNADQLIH